MASNFIVKIQYENTLRRLALGEADLDFSQLENTTRALFRISPTASLLLTYTDKDGDVITMADDDDLKDALVFQTINPLRINVKRISGTQNTAPIAEQRHSEAQATVTDLPESSQLVEETETVEASTESTEAVTEEKNSSVASEDPVLEKVSTKKPSAERTDAVTEVTNSSGAAEFPVVEKVSTGKASAEGEETIIEEAKSSIAEESQATADAAQVQPTATDKKSPESAAENKDCSIHFGVQCDGCETTPIKGARFKSTKTVNYDLCESCFENSGSVQDNYIKMDQSFARMFYPPHVRRMMQVRGSAPQLKNCRAGVHCKPQADSTSKAGCFEKSGGNVDAFRRFEEPAHDVPVVVGRVFRLASPYGRFGPRFGHYVWVLKQETAKNETDEKASEGQEKTETSVKEDLDDGKGVKQD